MKKIIAVLAICLMLTGQAGASIKLEYGTNKTGYDGIIAYYGVCVALLSAFCVFNPDRIGENTKKFVAVNAGIAGTFVFYKYYFGK